MTKAIGWAGAAEHAVTVALLPMVRSGVWSFGIHAPPATCERLGHGLRGVVLALQLTRGACPAVVVSHAVEDGALDVRSTPPARRAGARRPSARR